MKNNQRWLYGTLLLVSTAIFLFCLYRIVPDLQSHIRTQQLQHHISSVITESRAEEEPLFPKEAWNTLQAENSDYIGYLMFQSDLISEPIVQAYDNDVYLDTAFDGSYDGAGTVFLDSRASLESKNLTVYGHYVYYDSNSRFTPLEKLMDQEGYEDNQVVFLFLENEVRSYIVSSVLFITEEEAEYYDFSCPDMTEFEYSDWIAYVNMKNMIDPVAGKISEKDRLLTLQTCKKWDPSQRMLVICREVSRLPY